VPWRDIDAARSSQATQRFREGAGRPWLELLSKSVPKIGARCGANTNVKPQFDETASSSTGDGGTHALYSIEPGRFPAHGYLLNPDVARQGASLALI